MDKLIALMMLLFALILVGCASSCPECLPETHPKRYNCTTIDESSWWCSKDGVKFMCEYIN